MKMLKENCTLGKYDSIVAIMRIAVDYEYMDMESKTKMGCGSEASAGNNISCHSFLSEISIIESGISAPLIMIMYEITMTIVADYDHMEMYFQIGVDELFYFQFPFKVFIHFLNIRAITVSVETIGSQIVIDSQTSPNCDLKQWRGVKSIPFKNSNCDYCDSF
ncbi:hypothetical protein GIB67_040912, partial [Kingdonia uniflora]